MTGHMCARAVSPSYSFRLDANFSARPPWGVFVTSDTKIVSPLTRARVCARVRDYTNVLSDVTNGLADEWPLRWSSHRSQLGVGNFGKLKESAMNLNQDLQIEGS
jgi:hypothetical protein